MEFTGRDGMEGEMSETKVERYGFNSGQPRCLIVEGGQQCTGMAIADAERYGGEQICTFHRDQAKRKLAFDIAKGLNTGH